MTEDRKHRGFGLFRSVKDLKKLALAEEEKEEFWTKEFWSRDRFLADASAVMAGFQMTEEILRIYIALAYVFIKFSLHNYSLVYKFRQSDIKKYSLGQLLFLFCRLTDNKELIKELEELLPLRNEVAHRAFMRGFGENKHQENINEMTELGHRVASVNRTIIQATNKLRDELSNLAAQEK